MATKSKPLQAPTTAKTSVAIRPSNGVVSVAAAIAAQVASMSERITPPGGSKIKLAPGSMTLPDGTKTPGPLEMVIVDFVAKNTFYEHDYDPNNTTSPVCFSINTIPAKMVPSPNSPLPQAKTCAECPMNQFGSKGRGKACKNERILAVLPPGAGDDVALSTISICPTKTKAFDGFVQGLQRMQTIPVGMITTLGLDPNETYAAVVCSDPVPNPDINSHFGRQGEAAAMLAIEPDVSGYGIEKAPTKAAAKRPAVRR